MPDKLPKDMTMAERRALYSKHRHPPTTDREARNLERVLWLFREMPRIKPATVLDVGCESGFITRWMVDEPYVKQLAGIDPCEFSIEHAENMVKKRNNPAKARYAPIGWEEEEALRGLGNPNGLWDAIVCFEVIEHFLPEEGKQLIKRIDNLLDKGSTAFLCTPSAEGRYGLKNPDPWHLKIYTQDELGKLVKEVTDATPEFEGGDPDFTMLKWRKPDHTALKGMEKPK
jgi:2-polyprenyl-3-methyl-5-hydroxy-6-metoxy-1,4-benzoquinol methylase